MSTLVLRAQLPIAPATPSAAAAASATEAAAAGEAAQPPPPLPLPAVVYDCNSDEGEGWGVDLGAATDIDAIRLFQRTDCCRGRFSGFVIYTSQTNASARAAGPARSTCRPWACSAACPTTPARPPRR
jgi:cell division septation protein DedD